MKVTKQLLNGSIQAVTDRNHFTKSEFHTALVDKKYIGPFDYDMSNDLWDSQLMLIEVSKRMPVKTRVSDHIENFKAA